MNSNVLNILDHTHGELHRDPVCVGKFRLFSVRDVPHVFDAIGVELVSETTFVACRDCGATFYAPGAERKLEDERVQEIAIRLTEGNGPTFREMRFLRLQSCHSRETWAKCLDLSDEGLTAIEAGGYLHGEKVFIKNGRLADLALAAKALSLIKK